MKNVILFLLLVSGMLITACQDVTIGYLVTEGAGYNPDTLVVKKELDATPPTFQEVDNELYYDLIGMGYTPEDLALLNIFPTRVIEVGAGEDYQRATWGQPWVSTPIEGVSGTSQIYVSVKAIKTTAGDPEKLWKYLKVYGDGTFEIPLKHEIPAGRYVISLNFINEGYSKDVDDCFTIVVK